MEDNLGSSCNSRNTQSKILTEQGNRMTNATDQENYSIGSSSRRVQVQTSLYRYTPCSAIPEDDKPMNLYTYTNDKSIYDFDLRTIIEKYGDYSELLELILSCKLQEDRRKTEEAKLKQKEIDYFLSNQEELPTETDANSHSDNSRNKERTNSIHDKPITNNTTPLDVQDASKNHLNFYNEKSNQPFRTNKSNKIYGSQFKRNLSTSENHFIYPSKEAHVQLNRCGDTDYDIAVNQNRIDNLNSAHSLMTMKTQRFVLDKVSSHTLPPLQQSQSITQIENPNRNSSVTNYNTEQSSEKGSYIGMIQQNSSSPYVPNVNSLSSYIPSMVIREREEQADPPTYNRSSFQDQQSLDSTTSEEHLSEGTSTDTFPKMPINRLVRYNANDTSTRPRRRQKLLQAITLVIETKEFPYDDGYTWKNNGNTVHKTSGQKSIYYKCSNSSMGCPVNKTVAFKEDGKYVIKYRGHHLDECNIKATKTVQERLLVEGNT